MLKSLKENTVQIYKALLAWCITILLLPFLLFCWIYKQCVVVVGKIHGLVITEDCISIFIVEKVAVNDKVLNEHERRPLCNIGTFIDLGQGNIDLKDLIQRVQKNLIDKERTTAYKLKSYLVRFGGYSFWKQNPEFQTAHHVHKVRLPPGEDILDFLNAWMTEPYPARTSLWRILVVDAGSTEYLAIKIHHGMGDGMSINEVAISIFDTKYRPRVQELFMSPPRWRIMLDIMIATIKAPVTLMEVSAKLKQVEVPFEIADGIEVEQFTSLQCFNLHDIKSISKKQGVTVMAVLLTIFGEAVRKYLTSIQGLVPESLVVVSPQPWAGRPQNYIGNCYNTMQTIVPLRTSSPLETLNQVQVNITQYYASKAFLVYKHIIQHLPAVFPSWLVGPASGTDWGRCSLSPVLTADEHAYDGRMVRSCAPLGGVLGPGFGMFSMALSRKGELAWTIVGAKSLFKTKENLNLLTQKYMVEVFESLLQASNKSNFIFMQAP